jgi:hypothetical protein
MDIRVESNIDPDDFERKVREAVREKAVEVGKQLQLACDRLADMQGKPVGEVLDALRADLRGIGIHRRDNELLILAQKIAAGQKILVQVDTSGS